MIEKILEARGFISGGFPRSLVSKRRHFSDIDIFVSDPISKVNVENTLMAYGWRLTASHPGYPPNGWHVESWEAWENMYTSKPKFQVIYRPDLSISEILANFDITVVKCYLKNLKTVAYLDETCYIHETAAQLVFTKNNAMYTLARIDKYINKGYKISENELIKLFANVPKEIKQHFINQLNWQTFKSFKKFHAIAEIAGYDCKHLLKTKKQMQASHPYYGG